MAEEKHTGKKRSPAGKLGYAAYKATDTAMEAVASVVRAILKIFGSAFIVILLSGMLFAGIFASAIPQGSEILTFGKLSPVLHNTKTDAVCTFL